MATTLHRIDFLVNGARTSAGAVVASGKVRFYLPGTSTPVSVYSDDAGSSAITPPLTLDAGGRGTAYALGPVRVVVKDTTETTTYVDTVDCERADRVYITNTSVNAGVETTVDAAFSDISTSLGAGFLYKESTNASERYYIDVLGERYVSVFDFGAVGDGIADDTGAVQAAIDRAGDRGGGRVLVPYGTFNVTGITISDRGVQLVGTGRNSIINNTSTSTDCITVATTVSVDAKVSISNLAITASTTSSGVALRLTTGDRVFVENVTVASHRTGFRSATTANRFVSCTCLSTDDNASSYGFYVGGTRDRVIACEAIQATTNGIGFELSVGSYSTAIDCYAYRFGTGFKAGISLDGCHAASAATGFSVGTGGDYVTIHRCLALSCTYGFDLTGGDYASVLACHANTCTSGYICTDSSTRVRVVHCTGVSNTNDIGSLGTVPNIQFDNGPYLEQASLTTISGTGTQNYTPTAGTFGRNVTIPYKCTGGAGTTVALQSTATSGLVPGQTMNITVHNATSPSSSVSLSGTAQYVFPDGTTTVGTLATIASAGTMCFATFRWSGTAWVCIATGEEP